MPRIVRAEFLRYYNSLRNSDKLFNVFVLEDDDGTFRCVSEHGRRGNNLVRDTLCAGETRESAENKLRQKIGAKRSHSETPYTYEPFGENYSQIADEYDYKNRTINDNDVNLQQFNGLTVSKNAPATKANVIEFPVKRKENSKTKPRSSGILNQGQFDSLEI